MDGLECSTRQIAAIVPYSQARSRSDTPPMFRSIEPTNVIPPIDRVQVEKPRFPQAGFLPFSARARAVGRTRRRRAGEYPAGVAGAAFFDLDRTLLAGRLRCRCFSDAMRDSGFVTRGDPGRAAAVRAVQRRSARRCRRWLLARQAPPWPRARRGRRCGAAAEAAAATLAAMVQPFAWQLLRRAPRRRPAGGAGHHHAVRPGQAARRLARLRRRHRHALRRRRRRHLRRHDRRPVRVGAPASCAAVREWAERRTASTSARASPTPTACYDLRCCRPSATRSRSTPTRAWS